ncbi:unnamed protein product [Nesidiocoris tenuis]|uniref:Uncharacterized protein n=1 Tax=Nesidiocoris tenuis TaxID=355587 RepID=A0A6H5H9F8_9HEMI|nr:unnamed protein product [Nesidiocoris tenuis]
MPLPRTVSIAPNAAPVKAPYRSVGLPCGGRLSLPRTVSIAPSDAHYRSPGRSLSLPRTVSIAPSDGLYRSQCRSREGSLSLRWTLPWRPPIAPLDAPYLKPKLSISLEGDTAERAEVKSDVSTSSGLPHPAIFPLNGISNFSECRTARRQRRAKDDEPGFFGIFCLTRWRQRRRRGRGRRSGRRKDEVEEEVKDDRGRGVFDVSTLATLVRRSLFLHYLSRKTSVVFYAEELRAILMDELERQPPPVKGLWRLPREPGSNPAGAPQERHPAEVDRSPGFPLTVHSYMATSGGPSSARNVTSSRFTAGSAALCGHVLLRKTRSPRLRSSLRLLGDGNRWSAISTLTPPSAGIL